MLETGIELSVHITDSLQNYTKQTISVLLRSLSVQTHSLSQKQRLPYKVKRVTVSSRGPLTVSILIEFTLSTTPPVLGSGITVSTLA